MRIRTQQLKSNHKCMELSNELVGENNLLLACFQGSMGWKFILSICWHLLHLLISLMHIGSRFIPVLECRLISSGFWGKYQLLNLENLQYLAIVVDSEEAKNTTKLKQLLQWLSDMGVYHVILYDMEGVLKNYVDTLLENPSNSGITSCSDDIKAHHQGRITLELLSLSDSKEGAAKAASILCSKYLKDRSVGIGKMETNFTETDMADALRIVGCGTGPDPDLLLIFGPARCHLGFPAWRIRYTEIVHMGSLKCLTYGATVKAIHDYSKKHQNYGI